MKKISLLLLAVLALPAAASAQSGPSWRVSAGLADFKDVPQLWDGGYALQFGSDLGVARIPTGGPDLALSLTADATAGVFPLEEQVIDVKGGTLFALTGLVGAKAELDAVVAPYVTGGVGFTSFQVTDLKAGDEVVEFGEIADDLALSWAGGVRFLQGRIRPYVEYRHLAVDDAPDHSMVTFGISIR